MLSQCFTLLLTLDLLSVPHLQVPSLGYDVAGIHIRNLTCNQISLPHVSGKVSSSSWLFLAEQPGKWSCMTELESTTYKGNLLIDMVLLPSEARLYAHANRMCETEESTLDRCDVKVSLLAIRVDPPNAMIDMSLRLVRTMIEGRVSSSICNEMIPMWQQKLLNHTTNPRAPLPSPTTTATALHNSPLFRAATNLVRRLPDILGMHIHLELAGDATARIRLVFSDVLHFSYDGTLLPAPNDDEMLNISLDDIFEFIVRHTTPGPVEIHRSFIIPKLPAALYNLSVGLQAPAGTEITVDVNFADLICERYSYTCTVPASGGIYIQNVYVSGMGDVGRLVTNDIGPQLVDPVNSYLSNFTYRHSDSRVGRYVLPMRQKASIVAAPPTKACVLVLVGMAVVSFLLLCMVARRESHSPTLHSGTGQRVHLWRVLAEDALLCAAAFLCAGGFLWSNLTTAASVVIGGELQIHTFSLKDTVVDLWSAGLKPLAILVFLFSGVYPYFKLVSVLAYTIVLRNPKAPLLRLIDYFGKYSLLDTFAMIIMVSGLRVDGMAEVRILPPFYVFIAATVGSLAVGNYATVMWRCGTGIHTVAPPEVAAPLEGEEATHNDSTQPLLQPPTVELPKTSLALSPQWSIAMPCGVAVLLCTVPVWLFPCIRYEVGGVAQVVVSTYKALTLYDLSSGMGMTCLVLTALTVMGVPFLYVVTYPAFSFLAAWCAADVLLLACVASLLQLDQFIQFVLGDGMETVYTARAHLLWPLVPLLVSAMIVWMLIMLTHYSKRPLRPV